MTATQSMLDDADLLRRLIAFDSTSRNSNLPIADFICDYLEAPGVRVERQLSDCGEKVNLAITTGPPPDAERAGLTLSGHLDVVPADEPEWTGDPFAMRQEDDRFIGRGTCDMKGFVALAVNALARGSGRRLTAPLTLLLTFDEELGTLGARHFAEHWPPERPLPRRVLIGEPTSLRVVRLHKGHASARLEVAGRPAHSGYPHLGHNAIEPLGRAIAALADLRRDLAAEGGPNADHFPEVPYVALNLAMVEGGTAINIVPDGARLTLGYRVLPGMSADAVTERVRRCLEEVLTGERWHLETLGQSPPMLLPEEHDFYHEVCRLSGQQETVSASYATDGGWLHHAGFDCLLYGPGDIAVAHRPDEWLPREEFERCGRDLQTLVGRLCVDA